MISTKLKLKYCFLMLLFSSCSQGVREKLVVKESIRYEKAPLTSQLPPLTPELIDEAIVAFEEGFVHEAEHPKRWWGYYPNHEKIVDQGHSPLCFAFAFRDLLVNNLRLNTDKVPSIFSLLKMNLHDSTKVLLSHHLSYSGLNYNLLKMGSVGVSLETEEALPFTLEIFDKYYEIKNGLGFNSEKFHIPPSVPKALKLPDMGEDALYGALLVDMLPNTPLKESDYIKLPKFRFLQSTVNTATLVNEMRILGKRLGEGKSQAMSVCGNDIRGFSEKLVGVDRDQFEYENTDSGSSNCTPHAVLVTSAKKDKSSGEVFVTFKNSYGTDFTDTGYHQIPLKRFIAILRTWSDEKWDDRISSRRIELERVDDKEDPVHVIENHKNWIVSARTQDGVLPWGKVSLSHRLDKTLIHCDVDGGIAKNCSGTLNWQGTINARNHYTYQGDVAVSGLSFEGVEDFWEQGHGKVYLWGNLIKEGTFDNGVLRKGVYKEYFSGGKSPIVSLVDEGEFDEAEDLIQGVRKFFDRSGKHYKTEKIGI